MLLARNLYTLHSDYLLRLDVMSALKSTSSAPSSRFVADPPLSDDSNWGGLQPVYVTLIPKSVCLNRRSYVINPALVALLDGLHVDPAKALNFNIYGYKKFKCVNSECDRTLYYPLASVGRFHPYQSDKHAQRCLAKVMDRVDWVRKRSGLGYLTTIDLTCPRWVSTGQLDHDTVKRLRRAVNVFLGDLHGRLFGRCQPRDSRLGGFYSIHIWKSKNPHDYHLHVHLNLLNVALDRNGRFHRFKPFVSEARVKSAWRSALESVGLWDDPVNWPNVFVRYIPLKETDRVAHRVLYVYRRPLHDLNDHLDLGGVTELLANDKWANHLLRYVPRVCNIGFFSNLKKVGYTMPKSFADRCPFCASPLVYLKAVTELPRDIPFVYRTRAGWILEPP